MENTRRRRKPVSAEAIARLADEGRDVSRFFTNKGRMMGPIQRVNVDLASGMLEELDRAAKELNISRQAVIKTLIRKRSISNIWREEAPPPLSGDSPESLRQSASPQFESRTQRVLQLLESKLAARAAGSTKQITEDMVMAKRDILGELVEGVAAMKSHRESKLTLRSYKIEVAPLPKVDSKLIRDTRKSLRCSRAVFARKLRINERTLENGNRGV